MRLGSALPFVLNRQRAIVKPDFPLITVLYLLRMQDLAGVPLTSDNNECKAVFGFSSLERLVRMGHRRFASFVQEPCVKASDRLDSLTVDQELGELLDSFKSTKLGCAALRSSHSRRKWSLVTLADVLTLYGTGLIRTDMVAEDVASPIFAMPGDASIREALETMLEHQYRRIFVEREGCYISDRSIIDYILSPEGLDSLVFEPRRDPLAAPMTELWSTGPVAVGQRTNLGDAALKLQKHGAECLVVRGGKVITPWDLVMKPWLAGKLLVAEETEAVATAPARPRSRRDGQSPPRN